MSEVVLELDNLVRSYTQGGKVLEVFKGANLQLRRGEVVALVGPSGAGKSSLLHIAGLLERPDSGEVILNGVACGNLLDRERTALRRTQMGFIYQFHHLLPEFSALENVALPQMILGRTKAVAKSVSKELLEALGLGERADHRPAQLSGGEQQRVAIARAIANGPKVLLADEPTGNLDPETAARVFGQLLAIIRENGLACLIATHNPELARSLDRVVVMDNGELVAQN